MSFHLYSACFLIFFPLWHELFRCVLSNLKTFTGVPGYLLLVSTSILLWSEGILCMVPISLKIFRLALCPMIKLTLGASEWAPQKELSSAVVGGMSDKRQLPQVSWWYYSSLLQTCCCYFVRPVTESGLKSPSTTAGLTFEYPQVLSSGAHINDG